MSRHSRTEKLKKLLVHAYGSSENPWISQAETEKVLFDAVIGDGVPVDLIRDWYLIRASKNDEQGKPIEGVERLVENLNTTQTTAVFTHGMVDAHQQRYSIFTNPETNELLGLLRYPVPSPRNQSPSRTKRLKDLVAKSFGSSENPWISKSEKEKAVFDVADGRGILLKRVRGIYSSRGRRNKERGSPIDGFDSLLKNLDKTQSNEILIHGMVDNSQREYRIFTDPEITELVGVLRFPVERSTKRFVL